MQNKMPLNPTKTYIQNGLLINEFLLKESDTSIEVPPWRLAAAPSGICIYTMPDLPIRSTTSLAEYYTRRTYFGDMKTFVPHYYVDNLAAWKILENGRQGWHGKNFLDNTNKLGVVICGSSKQAKFNVIKLVLGILKEFNLGLNSVIYKFDVTDDFKNELCRRSKNLNIKQFIPIFEETEQVPVIKKIAAAAPVIPQINFSVYVNNNWQQPIKNKPIQAIKINIDQGELFYRTHLLRGGWLDWVGNNEVSGHFGTYIDGFQIKYINNDYELLYCFSTIKGPSISWRTTNFTLPTLKQIDLINFKIKPL